MARNDKSGRPVNYAQEKLPTLRKRKADVITGAATAEMVQVAWPGVPADAMHGFTSFSTSATEDTALAGNKFHEIGLYQTEAGLRDGPAPNPDPDAEYSNWTKLADSPLVRTLLGGSATIVPGAWKTALRDQIAVGMANLLYHAEKMNNSLPIRLKQSKLPLDLADAVCPSEGNSVWKLLWSFTAFSRGEGQFYKVLEPYLTKLGNEPEATRWQKWRSLVLQDIRDNKGGIGAQTGKMGAAYALIRSEQKFQSGYALALATNGEADWFSAVYTGVGTREEAHLAAAAYPL